SSVIVYFGFALGFFNTYLFTREGGFTKEEYGLTGTFIAIGYIMYSAASLGMPAYISKFFPYYTARLQPRKNDMLTWALLLPLIGFSFVTLVGVAFKNILIDKIFDNSPELLQYYYWLFPFGFGITIFMVLEAYAWQQRKSVLSNFLKEVLLRFFVTLLIGLTFFGVIKSFDVFIGSYSFIYIAAVLVLMFYFYKNDQLHLTFSVSKVTRRFKKKIITLCTFVWGGGLVFNIANVFDTIVLAAVLPNGMAVAGVFTLAQNISSLIQAPQRGITSASIGPLSQAWREKDYDRIDRIYHRSSINQLLFASAMFSLIWMNFEDGIRTFHLQEAYLAAKWVFFYIGLTKVIDMGTGVNAQIIATSTFWRFEFITGLILLAFSLPLNYFLTRQLGVIGPAISGLIAFTVYNSIRYFFLWNKFQMQPFTYKSILTLALAATGFFIVYYFFHNYTGLLWMVIRSAVFVLLFATGMFLLNLSPDVKPVLQTIRKRLRLGV
ncbi:MAG: polysaccharide biosynthesis C-terminal domain-containing protein, partial [Bacteroidota bacterium]|nr:polysaccharide biosynthesis C-terminal domain-containing protein [Bacteroidota bacterium]